MRQTSRGKFNRRQRATAESTTSTLDGYGLRGHQPARPAPYASYPVLVHRLASLLHAAFRPRLATKPLHFAITPPPSGFEGDLHPKAVKHARPSLGGQDPDRMFSVKTSYLDELIEDQFLAVSISRSITPADGRCQFTTCIQFDLPPHRYLRDVSIWVTSSMRQRPIVQ